MSEDHDRTASLMTPAKLAQMKPKAAVSPSAWLDQMAADAGHAHLIRRVHADPQLRGIVLTTEEEGIAVSCGAWLGGERAVLLMQSSGVGNCINMLSLVENGRVAGGGGVTKRGGLGGL